MHGSASFPFGKKSFFSRKVRKILMPVFLILSQNFTSSMQICRKDFTSEREKKG